MINSGVLTFPGPLVRSAMAFDTTGGWTLLVRRLAMSCRRPGLAGEQTK